MASLIETTSGLKIVTPPPVGDGGAALNYNFTVIGDKLAAHDTQIQDIQNQLIAGGLTGAPLNVVGTSDTVQLSIKANATQTHDLTQWQNASGEVLASVSNTGHFVSGLADVTDGMLTLFSSTRSSDYSFKLYVDPISASIDGGFLDTTIQTWHRLLVKVGGGGWLGGMGFTAMEAMTYPTVTFTEFAGTFSGNETGIQTGMQFTHTYTQASDAGSTDFQITRTEKSLGSGTHKFINLQQGNTSRFSIDNTGRLYLTAPNSAPADADLGNSQFSFYLDEANNALKIRVRYSNGTYKTATLALT